MDVSSISHYFSTQQVNIASNVKGGGRDNDGDNDGSGQVGSKGGPNPFFMSVMKALGQSGLSLPQPQSSSDSNTGNSQSGHNQSVEKAMHAFMHSLFQAMQQSGSLQNKSGTGQADSDGDNDGSRAGESEKSERGQQLANAAQQLLNSFNNGSTTNPSQQALQSSFQNLVQALGGSSTGGADLQSFLQSFAADLGGMTPPATGNLHSSKA